jgi:hypothetical protein
MKKKCLLLIGAAILIFAACQKTNTDDLTFMLEEKKCENPWDALPEQGNYIVEIRGFLNQQGIDVVTLEIDVYDEKAGTNCVECDCPTGRNIFITVPPKDGRKAEDVGFVIVK